MSVWKRRSPLGNQKISAASPEYSSWNERIADFSSLPSQLSASVGAKRSRQASSRPQPAYSRYCSQVVRPVPGSAHELAQAEDLRRLGDADRASSSQTQLTPRRCQTLSSIRFMLIPPETVTAAPLRPYGSRPSCCRSSAPSRRHSVPAVSHHAGPAIRADPSRPGAV